MADPKNPFAPPTARVEDIAAPGESQPVTLWSARGRLGRLRYIAWSIVGSLLLMPVVFASAAVGSGALASALMLAGYAAYLVFFALLSIQRSHDFNASGWLALAAMIPLVGLVFWFVPGTASANRFGAPPPPNPRGMGWLAAIPVFLFVLGIVAAIALPAYQQYVKRAAASQNR
jgi:uncharacterized membrane protein YhaH (DUF805 family)